MQVQVTITIDSKYFNKLEAFLESIENDGKASPEVASKQTPKRTTEENPQSVEPKEKSTEEIVDEFVEALDEYEKVMDEYDQENTEETPEEKPKQAFTHEDARAKAYEALQAGKGAIVKQALAKVGAKKVPDISQDKIGEFMEALTW